MDGIEQMVPIRVCWDRILDEYPGLISQAISGVTFLVDHLPRRPKIQYLGVSWDHGEYGSTDWYLDRSRLPGGQVEAQDVIDLLINEPWQEDEQHLDLLLTGRDLTTEGCNYLFGRAWRNANVQSIYRFVEAGLTEEQIGPLIRHVVFHELGHNFGLVQSHWPNYDRRGGIYTNHCSTPGCAMNQFPSLGNLITQVAPEGVAIHPSLCNECRTFLLKKRWD